MDETTEGSVVQILPDPLEDLCTWSDNPDEQRRVFVLVNYNCNGDLEKMDKICKWLKDGTLPHKLKAVKE